MDKYIFLIEQGGASHFHRLKSDEMWYYHGGSPLDIYMITPQGELKVEKLGLNVGAGENLKFLYLRIQFLVLH